MAIFKSTSEILNEPWTERIDTDTSHVRKVPLGWDQHRPMTIDDVVIWEQIYYQGGNIGIYVSWSPRAEFYMIVYNLFTDSKYGIETFYGNLAYDRVAKKANNLGIYLPVNKVYTDNEDLSHISES